MKVTKIGSLVLMSAMLVACGGKDKKDGNDSANSSAAEEDVKIEARTVNVTAYPNLPIEGESAEYFKFEGENGPEITLTGTPKESGNSGEVIAKVKITYTAPDEPIWGLYSTPRLPLSVLDAKGENISNSHILHMVPADASALDQKIKNGEDFSMVVTYTGDLYSTTYNKLFDEGKHIQMQSARLVTVAEHEGDDTTGSNGGDIDITEDEYEALVEKAKSGDTEAQSLLEAYTKSLMNSMDKMTAAQKEAWEKALEIYKDAGIPGAVELLSSGAGAASSLINAAGKVATGAYERELEKAMDDYEKELNQAMDDYEKELNDAMNSYGF